MYHWKCAIWCTAPVLSLYAVLNHCWLRSISSKQWYKKTHCCSRTIASWFTKPHRRVAPHFNYTNLCLLGIFKSDRIKDETSAQVEHNPPSSAVKSCQNDAASGFSVVPKNLLPGFLPRADYSHLSCLPRLHLDRFMEDGSAKRRIR